MNAVSFPALCGLFSVLPLRGRVPHRSSALLIDNPVTVVNGFQPGKAGAGEMHAGISHCSPAACARICLRVSAASAGRRQRRLRRPAGRLNVREMHNVAPDQQGLIFGIDTKSAVTRRVPGQPDRHMPGSTSSPVSRFTRPHSLPGCGETARSYPEPARWRASSERHPASMRSRGGADRAAHFIDGFAVGIEQSANMVGVTVRQQDRIDVGRRDAQLAKARGELTSGVIRPPVPESTRIVRPRRGSDRR
ncbi:Uncharacterised protein [Raoultella terrigena]|uniref:Uncharacterized protein n=1 Tax=Raoultella terrigena TaxID=577 RepID=A0A4U9D095_RAOTE|nr:Uncharacterised protein [Raoultella terrigena]